MGQSAGAVERARRDLAEDRPWKARERLRSYLIAYPADQPARELLGDVEWEMRNVPGAGAAWLLTERDDERAGRAMDVLRAEHAGPTQQLIGALAIKPALVLVAPLDPWPSVVRERLQELRSRAIAEREGRPLHAAAGIDEDDDVHDSLRDRVGLAGCLVVALATLAAIVVGAITIVVWVVDQLS